MADEQRFDRMEKQLDKLGDKIDDLTKVVTTMARIEERMVTLFKRMEHYDDQQADLDARLTAIETTTTKRGVVYHAVEKGFWLIVGAGLAVIVKLSETA